MLDSELAALASSGATTVVGLMVSDAWTQVRDRVARFFTRGGHGDAAAEELELSRQELMAAHDAGDEQGAADTQAAWRIRLRRVLLSDPAAAQELRGLLHELEPLAGQSAGATVHNVVSGGTQHGPVIQSRDISGLTFRTASPQHPSPEQD